MHITITFHPHRKGLFLPKCPRHIFDPTGSSSLEQFPEDGYFNIRKLSEDLRRLRGGWERYGRRECEHVSERDIEVTDFRDSVVKGF